MSKKVSCQDVSGLIPSSIRWRLVLVMIRVFAGPGASENKMDPGSCNGCLVSAEKGIWWGLNGVGEKGTVAGSLVLLFR